MAAASSRSSVGQIQLGDLPHSRTFLLSLIAQIDNALERGIPRELGGLLVYPIHFVVKGGAAAEIQLGTTDFADIDTVLYVSPDFKDPKRREIRSNAIRIVLETLLHTFQSDTIDWSPIRSELTTRGYDFLTIPNNVMYEQTFSTAHVTEPAFVGIDRTPMKNECPFGIWIRENVTAGPTPLHMDLLSVVMNVNLPSIHKRVVLDLAIPHIYDRNSYYEFKASEPIKKRVEGIDVPIEKPLALFIDQYAASRSPERNEGKTMRRAARADRILTTLLTPELAVPRSPLYSEMRRFTNFNRVVPRQTLPSGNRFKNVIQKVRERAPTPELRTAPRDLRVPILTMKFSTPGVAADADALAASADAFAAINARLTAAARERSAPGGQAGARGGGQAQPSTGGGGSTRRGATRRRRARTQRRK